MDICSKEDKCKGKPKLQVDGKSGFKSLNIIPFCYFHPPSQILYEMFLYLYTQLQCLAYCLALKVEAVSSSEIMLCSYQTKWCQEGSELHSHCHENLQSQKNWLLFFHQTQLVYCVSCTLYCFITIHVSAIW
jgi:hypothetical protein